MKYFYSLLISLIVALPAFSKEKRLSQREVAQAMINAGFDAKSAQVMTCLAHYESNFRPKITHRNANGTLDTGLLQVNDVWLKSCKMKRSDLKNPTKNAKCAYKIVQKQGLTAWVTYKKFKSTCLAYTVPGFPTSNIAENAPAPIH